MGKWYLLPYYCLVKCLRVPFDFNQKNFRYILPGRLIGVRNLTTSCPRKYQNLGFFLSKNHSLSNLNMFEKYFFEQSTYFQRVCQNVILIAQRAAKLQVIEAEGPSIPLQSGFTMLTEFQHRTKCNIFVPSTLTFCSLLVPLTWQGYIASHF